MTWKGRGWDRSFDDYLELVKSRRYGDFGPDVDVAAAGFGVQAFVTLEIAQGALDDVHRDLAAIPGVLEAHATTGSGDLAFRQPLLPEAVLAHEVLNDAAHEGEGPVRTLDGEHFGHDLMLTTGRARVNWENGTEGRRCGTALRTGD